MCHFCFLYLVRYANKTLKRPIINYSTNNLPKTMLIGDDKQQYYHLSTCLNQPVSSGVGSSGSHSVKVAHVRTEMKE